MFKKHQNTWRLGRWQACSTPHPIGGGLDAPAPNSTRALSPSGFKLQSFWPQN